MRGTVLALLLVMTSLAGCEECPAVPYTDWEDLRLYDAIDAEPEPVPGAAISGYPEVALRGLAFTYGEVTLDYWGDQMSTMVAADIDVAPAARAFLENATGLTGDDLDAKVQAFTSDPDRIDEGHSHDGEPSVTLYLYEMVLPIDVGALMDHVGVTPDAPDVASGDWVFQFMGARKLVRLQDVDLEVDAVGRASASVDGPYDGDFEALIRQRLREAGLPEPKEMEFSAVVC